MKRLIPCVLLVLMAVGIKAQNMVGINAKIYQTKGDFNKNVKAVPAGISFNYLHGFKDKFSIGGELGVAMYANNQYEYETPFGRLIAIDEEDCFWTLHTDFRYYFYQIPGLKAYGQARVGITTFFSSRTPLETTQEFREEFEFHGTAFNAGVGGGVLLNFRQIFKNQAGTINLDLGAAVHSGSSANYRYMPEGSLSVTLNEGVYKSVTNYIDYRIGLLFVPSWKNKSNEL